MAHQAELGLLTLSGIAHRCEQETDLFFRRHSHDPRYCFELFRRAIVHRNQHAWELVYAQYRPLVSAWVERHPAFPATGEEVQYFVNRAFEKMWLALPSDRFKRFPDLKSLLRYLQMCVHSVILDQVRMTEQRVVSVPEGDLATIPSETPSRVGGRLLDRMDRREFWDQINARLHDDKERQVIYGSYVLALKPKQLYADFPEMFRGVTEIYRIKENVLARLRRDAELLELFG
jgi:DNA-directed RNA polymerase specialized sigma24 family protein